MFGEHLSEIRKDHNDRQSDLAQKLNISVSTVRSWEQNKSSPPNDMLISICKLYDVSADYLLGLTKLDHSYIQRARLERFSEEELQQIKEYEDYLLWKRKKR